MSGAGWVCMKNTQSCSVTSHAFQPLLAPYVKQPATNNRASPERSVAAPDAARLLVLPAPDPVLHVLVTHCKQVCTG